MKRWTKEEVEYLKENYSFKKNKELKLYLNRSINAIIRKANYYLKLRKIKFCKLCGKDISNLTYNAILCKSCSIIYKKNYKKEWAIKNRKRLAEKRLKYNLKNKEHLKELGRLWRLNNKEEKKILDKNYYNKIKILKQSPVCIDCGKILIGKNLNTKRCMVCRKSNKVLSLDILRHNNKSHYRELARKYVINRREKENQRRIKLGLPQVGNHFKREQELFVYIRNLFPNNNIIFHDRSALGNGLELDIFIPELNLAFEYNGRQHFDFKSTGYWKTYEEFEMQQLRDRLKRFLCNLNNIILIEINYFEKLSEQLILTKLKEKEIIVNQAKLIEENVHPSIKYEIGVLN